MVPKIGLYLEDIIERIKSVTDLNDKVGNVVGLTDIDAMNRHEQPPFVWVWYIGDDPDQQTGYANRCVTKVTSRFIVQVVIDRGNEQEQINTHLPLLHEIVAAVAGGEPQKGVYWLYGGQNLVSIDHRCVWQQQYSVETTIQNK